MRIVVLTHTFYPVVGGAEVGIHEIFKRFRDDEVVVLTSVPDDHADAFSTPVHREFPYRVIRYERWSRLFGSRLIGGLARRSGWQEFLLVRALHRDQPIDAVNIHFLRPLGLATLWIRLLLRLPVTVSLVGRTDVWRLMPARAKLLAHIVIRAATNCTEINRFCLEGSRLAPRAVELPYGVDLSEYSPSRRSMERRAHFGLRPEQTMLLAVQRLSPEKRVDLLLNIARKIEQEAPGEFRLVVAGIGSERPSLRSRIGELGLTNVSLVGYIEEREMPEVFASADVFVTHSMLETFGVVFAQAMASGLPIVAANTSCIPQVVADGINGFLVPPFDVDSFARLLVTLRRERQLALEIGQRNAAKAREKYDWESIARRLRKLLAGASVTKHLQ